nr:MFS transporter [uncultured Celeribacter sp.]
MSEATAETPAQPAPPAPAPGYLLRKALPYIGASMLLALCQGLGQGFVTSNLRQIAGEIGVTTTQASWLMAAYMIPRAALPMMLIKIRTQYGLRRFAEISIVAYVLVALASVWIADFRSALVVQVLSGMAAAPLSTLAFLYMLEPLSQAWKLRLGLPLVMMFFMSAPNLARVLSPSLLGDYGLGWMHLMVLGMAMASLAAVFLLPLRPVPHQKVIQRLDFLSFALITAAFAGITISFVMGPIHWWTDAPWIGAMTVLAVLSLTLVVMLELRRETPLIDVRWIMSPEILHLTGTLLLFRLILSEQSSGAPRMFQVLGVAPEQMTTLFAVIVCASIVGAVACVAWLKPTREPQFHLAALVLIAVGAWMDSHATIDTRPEQMIVSQALIGFAGMLFMPPAMMAGLLSALKKGPNYILSFVIIFISTQSLGAVVGSGVFLTVINARQAFHYKVLTEGLQATDAATSLAITQRVQAMATQAADMAQLKAQAVAQLATRASQEAYVMAYNDAYFLTFIVAVGAAVALILHLLRDAWVARRHPLPSQEQVQNAQ